MALRLDPARPLVWRTPFSLQVGVEPPVIVLDELSADDETVIELLRAGVTRPMLDDVVTSHGWSPARVDRLLERLSPVLSDATPPTLAGLDVTLDGGTRDTAGLRSLLAALGAEVSIGAERARRAASGAGARQRVAVVVSHYVVSPRAAAHWLRADVPHLLVRFGDRSIRVGPLVAPGAGPCAACLELQRTDRDAAWPAMAVQLARRRAPSADAFGLASLAPVVARILSSPGGEWSTRVVRIPRLAIEGAEVPHSGQWIEESDPVSPHPRCGCLSPPGNATVRALPIAAIRPRPTRARAAPWPG